MKQLFIAQNNQPGLLLFFAGWAMDEHLASDLSFPDIDCMLCFDYRDLRFDVSPLSRYRHLYAAAWSMGVWVAGQTLQRLPIRPEQSVAFNGTNHPVDNKLGIPSSIFEGTLRGFSEQTWEKFQRRMCGSAANLQTFKTHQSKRPLNELQDELAALYKNISSLGASTWHWDKAIIGLHDRIFPAANQQQAWQDTEIILADTAHYDAGYLNDLICGKEYIYGQRFNP